MRRKAAVLSQKPKEEHLKVSRKKEKRPDEGPPGPRAPGGGRALPEFRKQKSGRTRLWTGWEGKLGGRFLERKRLETGRGERVLVLSFFSPDVGLLKHLIF